MYFFIVVLFYLSLFFGYESLIIAIIPVLFFSIPSLMQKILSYCLCILNFMTSQNVSWSITVSLKEERTFLYFVARIDDLAPREIESFFQCNFL